MSIYKTPITLWDCITDKGQEDAIDHTADRIIGILRCAPDDWFSVNDCMGIFVAHTIWQQEYILAAWRTLLRNDRTRYNVHNNKMQYKPDSVTHDTNTKRKLS